MKKTLALALAIMMVLALCACGGSAPAEAPAEAPAAPAAPAEAAAPAAPAAEPAAPAEAAGDASGEASDDSGPVGQFDLIVNVPVIGAGAAEIAPVGGDAGKVVVDPVWAGSNGDTVTPASGVFQEGVEYTLSLTFQAAAGYELANPVNVKLVGGVSTEYQSVAAGANGIYELPNVATVMAGTGDASGEPSA